MVTSSTQSSTFLCSSSSYFCTFNFSVVLLCSSAYNNLFVCFSGISIDFNFYKTFWNLQVSKSCYFGPSKGGYDLVTCLFLRGAFILKVIKYLLANDNI